MALRMCMAATAGRVVVVVVAAVHGVAAEVVSDHQVARAPPHRMVERVGDEHTFLPLSHSACFLIILFFCFSCAWAIINRIPFEQRVWFFTETRSIVKQE